MIAPTIAEKTPAGTWKRPPDRADGISRGGISRGGISRGGISRGGISRGGISRADVEGGSVLWRTTAALALLLGVGACVGDADPPAPVDPVPAATVDPSVIDRLCPAVNDPGCPQLYTVPAGPLPSAEPVAAAAVAAPPVALLVPLSGQYAGIGQAMVDAAHLAVYNLADAAFELVIKDTRGTPEGAARAAQEALGEGAQLILGPLLSNSVRAAAPYALQRRVNMLAFTTDRRAAGGGVFVMGFLPRAEIERVVSYAAERGLRRFAALAPSNVYGRTAVQELRRAVGLYNGVVTVETFYDPAASDYSGMVRTFASFDTRAAAAERRRQQLEGREDEASRDELRSLSQREANVADVAFDALLLPDTGQRLLSIAPLLPFYDIDPTSVRFLGTGLWDEPAVLQEPALSRGWFAAPPPTLRRKFEEQFFENYQVQPIRLATLAYDATALAAVLARGGNPAPYSMTAITSSNGFAGIDGIFRFLQEGLIERGLSVLEVAGQEPKVVSPGRKSFVEPGGS